MVRAHKNLNTCVLQYVKWLKNSVHRPTIFSGFSKMLRPQLKCLLVALLAQGMRMNGRGGGYEESKSYFRKFHLLP